MRPESPALEYLRNGGLEDGDGAMEVLGKVVKPSEGAFGLQIPGKSRLLGVRI
jgi:hypothetical protein